MADVGVFSRYKGFADFQEEARKTGLAEALTMAKLSGRSGNMPAALQLANEYQKRLAAGDFVGANLIREFTKTQDKGIAAGANGEFAPLPGYATAVATIDAARAGAKQQAEANVDLSMKPQIGKATAFSEALGRGAGAAVTENTKAAGSLDSLVGSIQQAKELLPQVQATGPIGGRIGALAEDPQYRNLQGAINSITLQAKDLYNLGSGQGFTDADRKFLQEVIAGKYARAETIGLGLSRMEEAINRRQEYLAKQNAGINYLYGEDVAPTMSPVEANGKAAFEAKKPKPRLKYNPATGDFE